jgi:hypothetical protein
MSGLEFETDGHSELLACVKLPLQIVAIQLEIWDAAFGGLSNELLTSQAEQLGCFSARYLSLPIEFEDDKFACRLFHGALQLLEEINKILIELNLDGSHDCLGQFYTRGSRSPDH